MSGIENLADIFAGTEAATGKERGKANLSPGTYRVAFDNIEIKDGTGETGAKAFIFKMHVVDVLSENEQEDPPGTLFDRYFDLAPTGAKAKYILSYNKADILRILRAFGEHENASWTHDGSKEDDVTLFTKTEMVVDGLKGAECLVYVTPTKRKDGSTATNPKTGEMYTQSRFEALS